MNVRRRGVLSGRNRIRLVLAVVLAAVIPLLGAGPAFAAAPVVQNDSVTTDFEVPANISLQGTDADNDVLTFSVVAAPAHGTLDDCGNGFCTYTPDQEFHGDDTFTYQATDGTTDSNVATFTVTVLAPPANIVSAGPLTSVGTSAHLNCSVHHAGDTHGAFWEDTACGTFLVVDGTLYSPAVVPAGDSLGGTPWTPVSQTAVTGAGTAANPYRVQTVVAAGSTGVTVTQTDSYVVGQESYRTDVKIDNGGGARSVRLYRAADCYLEDSDNGLGSYDSGSGAVSCVSSSSDRILQWLPLSAGSHAYEAGFDEVWSRIGAMQVFPDTCRCAEDIDNGAGLSWDVSLAAGGSATRSSLITFSPAGALPLSTSKSVSSPSATAGSTVTYDITVHNPGSASAALTQISDQLPAGFSYVAGSTTGATTANPSVSGSNLTWAVSTSVPGGGDVTLSFDAVVSATPGTYYNNASAAATGLFVQPTGDAAPVTVTAVTETNRAPVAVDDSATTTQGTATTVNVLSNDSDADDDALSVTDSSQPSHGTVTCTASTCTYTPAAGYTGSDSFTYTVSDGQGGSDTGTVSVTVTSTTPSPGADLRITKVARDDTVAVGALTGYDITVTNLSNKAATQVAVQDALPSGFKLQGASPPCTVPAGVVTCQLGTVPADGTVSLAVTGAFVQAGSIVNTASVSSAGDPVAGNDTATETVQVTGKTCTVVGTFGHDNPLLGTSHADVICGLAGNDRINAKGGDDTVYGNEGADRIMGLGGDDLIDGGSGTDTTTYAAALQAVRVDLRDKQATGQGVDTFRSIENVVGSRFNDKITGDGAANLLKGLGGNDTISGLAGADTLSGGGGRDTLSGGKGKDVLRGGSGSDSCSVGGGGGSTTSC